MLRPPSDTRRQGAFPVQEEASPALVTFELHGPHAGLTGMLAGRQWIEGRTRVPAGDAAAFARVACFYYGAVQTEDNEMVTLIIGPTDDNEWQAQARVLARRRWPEAGVRVRHPAEWQGVEDGQLPVSQLSAVVVVQGCEYIAEAYQQAGLDPQHIASVPLAAPPPAAAAVEHAPMAPEKAPVPAPLPPMPPTPYVHQVLLERLLAQSSTKLRSALRNPDVAVLFADDDFVARLLAAERAGQARRSVLELFDKAARKAAQE